MQLLAMSSSVQAKLGTTCDGNGSFYVCNDKPSKFLGCCSIDPCKTNDGICPDNQLEYTSYDAGSHNMIKPQSCISNRPEVQWWTCGALKAPFMGCCSINPCKSDDGCPPEKLFAATLSSDSKNAAVFLPHDEGGDGALSTAAVGGIGAAGGVVLVLLLCGLAFYCRRRSRRRQSSKHEAPGPGYTPFPGPPTKGAAGPRSPRSPKTEFSPGSPYHSYSPSPSLDQSLAGRVSPWHGSISGQQPHHLLNHHPPHQPPQNQSQCLATETVLLTTAPSRRLRTTSFTAIST